MAILGALIYHRVSIPMEALSRPPPPKLQSHIINNWGNWSDVKTPTQTAALKAH